MKKQSLIKGTMILGVATIFARFLGLFFRIPIQNLIGDEGMGYYQMSYPLYLTFVALASGIPIAMSKLISEYRARHNDYAVDKIFRTTLAVMMPIGIVTSFLMLYFGKFIVTSLKWDIKSYYSFMTISVGPILVCLMCTFKGYFQGLQNMNATAVSQIIEQIGRVLFGVLCAYIMLPKGIEFAAAGAAFGTVGGGILGTIYLWIKYKRNKIQVYKDPKIKDSHNVGGKLIEAALPISVGAAVGTIMSLIDSIIVPQRLLEAGFSRADSAILYGQYTGKAMTIQNVPLALSMALCAALVPIVSEVYSMHKQEELNRRVELVFKMAMLIGLPSFLGLYYMAKPIMGLVFLGDDGGYSIMRILAIATPFIIVTQTTTSILQSCGRYMKPVYNLAIGCIFKVIITYILVADPRLNIYGAIAGSITGYLVTSILNIVNVKKLLRVRVSIFETTVKPALVSLIMIIAVVFIYNNVYNYTMSNGISCIGSVVIGVIIYGILVILFRIVTIDDIKGKLVKK